MTNLKFFYNGIKANGGKLQKATFDDCPLRSYPAGTITIRAREYRGFSVEIAEAFSIENNTDSQTDYFEKDCIRVTPNHPLYPQVAIATAKRQAHYA